MWNKQTLKENDVVTVMADRPEAGLVAGDVGAVVHCYPIGGAYEVEFVDANGRSKGVVTMNGNDLLRLNLVSLVA
jgi:hypothetical protein